MMDDKDKRAVLATLSVGSRVAEDEVEQLASYFVETDQWNRVIAGQVDVIFGAKGSGKSAIYASLLNRAAVMAEAGILLVSAENPRGQPAFHDLVEDPPTSEAEFIGLWKLYVLSLLAREFVDRGLTNPDADRVVRELTDAGLFTPESRPLRLVVRDVLDYVRAHLRPESIEGTITVDPATGLPVGVGGRITLREPGAPQQASGLVSADSLLEVADRALEISNLHVWVLFDRLDVAFADSRELEANALRALFKVYLDALTLGHVHLKVFLRTDIWQAITEGGFREASHITRTLEIQWNNGSLLHLLVRRLLQNADVVAYYVVDPQAVLGDSARQRAFFERLVPEQVDSGRNPKTFEWMLGRVQDGTRRAAPRELIHLASRTRDVQMGMLERGDPEPPDEDLFSRQAFREALPEVSKIRLEQTLYAEYPDLKGRLMALEGQKTNHDLGSLATIWQVDQDDAAAVAGHLVDIGFFERRGTMSEPIFWVPFIYRSALNLVQGTAD